jgi:acetyltransferase-like isoleucine patch superfamily enzyme
MCAVKSSVARVDGGNGQLPVVAGLPDAPQHRGPWPAAVRIGQGALIDDDVRLGSETGSSRSKAIEIGKGARIRGGSQVHSGVRAGDRLETGRNVSIGEDTVIGEDCRIATNTIIESDCRIGDRVRIDANCFIARFTTIQDDVTIAPGVCLANDPHPGSQDHACMRGPTIERGAQIGMNATVLPFITIGERSSVGAGSVVTREVPAAMVVAGNPARVLKSVTQITCPLDLEEGEYLRSPSGSGAEGIPAQN